jgi:hypothetical protein
MRCKYLVALAELTITGWRRFLHLDRGLSGGRPAPVFSGGIVPISARAPWAAPPCPASGSTSDHLRGGTWPPGALHTAAAAATSPPPSLYGRAHTFCTPCSPWRNCKSARPVGRRHTLVHLAYLYYRLEIYAHAYRWRLPPPWPSVLKQTVPKKAPKGVQVSKTAAAQGFLRCSPFLVERGKVKRCAATYMQGSSAHSALGSSHVITLPTSLAKRSRQSLSGGNLYR